MSLLRTAARRLARSPAFTLTAVAVLALAVGVNTSVISVASAVLIDALPYPDPDRLVQVTETRPEANLDALLTSVETYRDWKREARSFEELAAYHAQGTLVLVAGDDTYRLRANVVTAEYLPMLGATPALGRFFLPEEDEGWNAHAVAVMSHGLWERAFGGDPGIVGRGVRLSERAYTIVGVADRTFHDPALGAEDVDLWVPLAMAPAVTSYRPRPDTRGMRWLGVLGRIHEAVTPGGAATEMGLVAERLAREYPETNAGHGASVRPLGQVLFGNVQDSMPALMSAAAFVLLIGCANIANLLLMRGAARRRELAIKRALGLGSAGHLREALVEAALVSGAGGGLGVALAFATNARLKALLPIGLPAYVSLSPGLLSLSIAIAIGVGASLLFAAVPVLAARRDDVRAALEAGGRSGSAGRQRLQRAIVTVEVAAAVVLVVSGLLMIRSFSALHATGIGFDAERLLIAKIDLEGERFANPQPRRELARRLAAAIGALPGVRSTTVWGPRLPGEASWYTALHAEGRPAVRLSEAIVARRHHVSPAALGNLGIPITAGRDFAPEDDESHAPVAIVGEALAAALWPGEEAVGKRLLRWNPPDPLEGRPFTVIGVAADVKHTGRRQPVDNPRDVYFAYLQLPRIETILLVRAATPTAALVAPVRRAVRGVDPALPVYGVAAMEDRLRLDEAPTRFAAALMGLYAGLALLLALLGVYGVVSYAVEQRVHEMAVRVAVGATSRDLVRLVGVDTLRLVGTGLGLGMTGAWVSTALIRSLLFGVGATDPWTFTLAASLVLGVGVATGLAPAWRVGRLDAVATLRGGA